METGFFLTDSELRGNISKPDDMYMADYIWERFTNILSHLDKETYDYFTENIGKLHYTEIRKLADSTNNPIFALKILSEYFISDSQKTGDNMRLLMTPESEIYLRCPQDSKYKLILQYLHALSLQGKPIGNYLTYVVYEVLSMLEDMYVSKQILATYDKITPSNAQEIQPRHLGIVAKARDSLVVSIHRQNIMLLSTPCWANFVCYINDGKSVRRTKNAFFAIEVNKGTVANRCRFFMVFPDEPKYIYVAGRSDYADLCERTEGVSKVKMHDVGSDNGEYDAYTVPRQLLWQNKDFSEMALAYYTIVSCYVQMAITRYVVKPRGVENSQIPTGEEHSKHLVSLIKTVYVTNPNEVRFTYTPDKGIVSDTPRQKNAPKGGTHASPGAHNRRAHQRRLKSGKVIWVKASRVNPDKPPCKYRAATKMPIDFDDKP